MGRLPVAAAFGLLAPLFAALFAADRARSADPPVLLEVRAPQDDARVQGPIGWVELAGRAGTGAGHGRDVVIVLDLSDSTLVASGVDVDGDGVVARTLPRPILDRSGRRAHRQAATRPGDSVRAAEAAAARRLVALVDRSHTRVALVTFHGEGRLAAPLGSEPEVVETALDAIARESLRGGTTNFEAAIDTALDAFDADAVAATDPPPERVMLFLSDGVPTAPDEPREAQARAVAAADRAAAAGVPIHAFALGPEAVAGAGVFAEMARRSGGRFTEVGRPGEIASVLPRIDLADVASIVVANETTGQPGRAVRLFPDGSWDGYAPLRPGANRLRVTATSTDGRSASVTRIVHYTPRDAQTAAEREDVARFREDLQGRSVEMELRRAIERGRERQRKQLELGIEPPPP